MNTGPKVALGIALGFVIAFAGTFLDLLLGVPLISLPGTILVGILNTAERGRAIGVIFLTDWCFYAALLYLFLGRKRSAPPAPSSPPAA